MVQILGEVDYSNKGTIKNPSYLRVHQHRLSYDQLRADLDYGEELHEPVKSLAQDKVIWGNSWYGGRYKNKQMKQNPLSWSSLKVEFLVWGFVIAQQTWHAKNSPSISIAMLATSHFCIQVQNSPPGESFSIIQTLIDDEPIP
jgi:hypothetical protein